MTFCFFGFFFFQILGFSQNFHGLNFLKSEMKDRSDVADETILLNEF